MTKNNDEHLILPNYAGVVACKCDEHPFIYSEIKANIS